MFRSAIVLFLSIFIGLFLPGAAGINPLESSGDNWAQWRGPQGVGISAEKGFPEEWSDTRNVLWKTAIPGRGHSSPIVWGDRVFLTTAVELGPVSGAKAVTHYREGKEYIHPDSEGADRAYQLKVICLDRKTGSILWERTAYEGTPYDNRHRRNTYASSTPLSDGRYVYAFFEAEGLYCYDFEGNLVWRTSLGRIAKGGMGHGMSPVLFEDLIILQIDKEGLGLTTQQPDVSVSAGNAAPAGQFGEDSFITGLDRETGKTVWRTPRNNRRSWATPLLVPTREGFQLIASGAEAVIAYDPRSGAILWQSQGVVSHPIPSIVSGHGMIFASAGSQAKHLIALSIPPESNSQTISPVWSYEKGTAYVPSPILYGDYLYLLTDKGLVTCLDARSGEVKYEGGRVPVPATFMSSPVAFDGKILLSSEDGDTFILKAGPEHEILRTNSIGEPIRASLALSQGQIFIRGQDHLYCIGHADALPGESK